MTIDEQIVLESRLKSPEGLRTSRRKSDRENVDIINVILQQYLDRSNTIEASLNSFNEWREVSEMPRNFVDYKYRIKDEPR